MRRHVVGQAGAGKTTTKLITTQFVRGRIRKARKHPHRRRAADREPHLAKAVTVRSSREIDRYLDELRARADTTAAAPSALVPG